MEPPPPDLLAAPSEWAAYAGLAAHVAAYRAAAFPPPAYDAVVAASAPSAKSSAAAGGGSSEDSVQAALDAFLTPYCLRRYLRARSFDVEQAWTMLHRTLEWRRLQRPDRVTQASVADVYGLGTVFLAGSDRLGRPVVYMRPGAHNPYEAERRIHFMCWIMETSIAATDERRGIEKLVWVLDFADFGQRVNDDASRQTSRATLDMLQSHYPERLGRAFFINPPWYFRLLFAVRAEVGPGGVEAGRRGGG